MATTMTTARTDSVAPAGSGSSPRDHSRGNWRKPPWASWKLKTRLVAGSAVVLAVVGAAALLYARQVLEASITEAVETDLAQEAEELRSFAASRDPATGNPFGNDVERMLALYLERNAPDGNEAFYAFANGRWSARSGPGLPGDLTVQDVLPRPPDGIDTPARGSVATQAGALEYLAIPIRNSGATVGVFVVAILLEPAGVFGAPLGMTAVLLAIVIAVAVWLVARAISKTLDSVGSVTRAALEASAPRPDARAGARAQDHALAELEQTFNRVLQLRTDAIASQERFIHDAVHGLQGPIDAIRDHVERLDAHPRKEAARIPLVTEEVERVKARLEELVLLARSVRPDFLQLGAADLGDVLKDVRADMENITSRQWRLESVGPVRIVADPDRLRHALSLVAKVAVERSEDDDVITLGSVVLPGEARLWVRYKDRRASARIDEGPSGRSASFSGTSADARTGLAIPEAIAKAHRGRVAIAEGGDDVTMTIVVPSDQPKFWNGATHAAGPNGTSRTRAANTGPPPPIAPNRPA
jgi:hypothetical protein